MRPTDINRILSVGTCLKLIGDDHILFSCLAAVIDKFAGYYLSARGVVLQSQIGIVLALSHAELSVYDMFPSRELYGCVDIVVTVGIAVVAEIDIVRPINPAARTDFGHFPAPLHIAGVSFVRLAIEEIVHHVGCIPCDRMAYILCFIYLYILQCSDFGVGIEVL